jgi:putative ABC transport system substrate-binding protein
MKRREFITLISGAAAWPVAARAQQPAMPVIGYLAQGTPEATAGIIGAVRKGLGETGLVESKDFASELRWASNDADRLPRLANDLVQRRVAVIITLGTAAAARAAKAATTEIPIVFAHGTDPVKGGLVTSLNRPGGNVTGITTMNLDLGSKWIALLHELLPNAKRIVVLINLANADAARSLISGTQEATLAIGLQSEFVFASDDGEIDAAFAGLGTRAQALIVQPEVLFLQNREKLAAFAIREKLPAISNVPDFAQVGGLMSYGSSFIDAHRQAGVYVGRILKGDQPRELPVQQATKFDFVLNLKTAKALGLEVPPTLLARADEVIE